MDQEAPYIFDETDQEAPYIFDVTVSDNGGNELCAYRVHFKHEANALKLFDFAIGEITRNYDATRRAENGE